MFCSMCGKKLHDGDRFCNGCGAKLRANVSESELDSAINDTGETVAVATAVEKPPTGSELTGEGVSFDWNLDGFPSKEHKPTDDVDFNWAQNSADGEVEVEHIDTGAGDEAHSEDVVAEVSEEEMAKAARAAELDKATTSYKKELLRKLLELENGEISEEELLSNFAKNNPEMSVRLDDEVSTAGDDVPGGDEEDEALAETIIEKIHEKESNNKSKVIYWDVSPKNDVESDYDFDIEEEQLEAKG